MANTSHILSITHTSQGAILARKLPYPLVEGKPSSLIREHWHDCDALVVFLALGAVVRLISPLISNKHDDPAVVCVNSDGRWVIPVTGGHSRNANQLAVEIADLLGAMPVITTASDAEAAAATMPQPVLGAMPVITTASESGYIDADGDGHATVEHGFKEKIFVVGVGLSSYCTPADLIQVVEGVLSESNISRQAIESLATIDTRRDHPAVRSFNLPVRSYTAQHLSQVDIPNPSQVVRDTVGTPSVAEAAALLAAGPGAILVVDKITATTATVAIARRIRPRGSLSIVGIGPGSSLHRTPAATAAIRNAEMVIGYGAYVDMCLPILGPHQIVERFPIGAEVERVDRAVRVAAGGMKVVLVCSGDPGIYAMASPVFEKLDALSDDPWIHDMDITVVPGVTAAQATASLLGAPLGHDHAYISLSDLLTPWDTIENRLRAAASSGMSIALYNPASSRRRAQLELARNILLEILPPDTPVGVVDNAMRPAERQQVVTLETLDAESCTMTSCLLIGSKDTRLSSISTGTSTKSAGMYTPRGYVAR
ncbi:MAG: precorrin-3B C(17)-methyltransferase [Actinobacteria bacterium]|jgi:cobalt-precorrin 5A hydrolase/precorrin-3B C17-methyltransferase|nr:precorrin-3B C(17)-methyltransferase [Actinomycetota bacterium]